MSFLPKDYKSPTTNNHYMKIQEGENKFRILSKPIMGWEDWTLDKKPVRYALDKKPSKPLVDNKPIKHFWAFIVWNYNEEQIQILSITQATIRSCLESLCKDEDWGEPFHYDLKIIKKGEGTNTEYMINPLPKKPIHEYIIECFNAKPCNLDAIFTNEDPFAKWSSYTPAFFSQVDNFEENLKKCSPDYQKNVHDFFNRQGVKSIDELPFEAASKLRLKTIEEAIHA